MNGDEPSEVEREERIEALAQRQAVAGGKPTPAPRSAVPAGVLPTPTPSPSIASTPTPSPAISPTPSGKPIPLPNTAEVSAPSGDVVWALVGGSHLFVSSDRGDGWQERSLPAMPMNDEISFTSGTEGWAMRPGSPATQCQFQSVVLWRTTDGGRTWSSFWSSSAGAAPFTVGGIGGTQCKEALSFVDAQHGFISAWDENHAPVIYRTVDGGSRWSASSPLPDRPGFTTQAGGFTLRAGPVRAFGSTLLVEASGAAPANPGTVLRGYVFRSEDGGATWSYLATLPQRGDGFAFVTAQRWLEINDVGKLEETTDGGRSWHAYASDYSQAAPIAPVVTFGDAQAGYATVRGAIQRTLDGGAHWTVLHTPGTR